MNDINMLVWPISINNYPIFLLDILLCSVIDDIGCFFIFVVSVSYPEK